MPLRTAQIADLPRIVEIYNAAHSGRPGDHEGRGLHRSRVLAHVRRRGAARAYHRRGAAHLSIRDILAVVFGHNCASLALSRRFGLRDRGRLAQVAELDGIERDLLIVGLRAR
jgi:L-amino acid N-acyltransferase YncA